MKSEAVKPWSVRNGILQSAIKKVSFYNYLSPELCQRAILQKTGEQPERAVLLYETDRRETEIKAMLLYLPLIVILAVGSYFVSLGIISSNIKFLKACLLVTISLLFVYRVTFFEDYLYSRKCLLYAKEKLLDLIQAKPAGTQTVKGVISVILLEALINKECRRPGLFNGDIKKNVEYYAFISSCNVKNLSDKVSTYIKRENITLESENARTTHLRYLTTLSDHFKAIGDQELHLKAEELKVYISHLAISK
jgi:hypothetical protein